MKVPPVVSSALWPGTAIRSRPPVHNARRATSSIPIALLAYLAHGAGFPIPRVQKPAKTAALVDTESRLEAFRWKRPVRSAQLVESATDWQSPVWLVACSAHPVTLLAPLADPAANLAKLDDIRSPRVKVLAPSAKRGGSLGPQVLRSPLNVKPVRLEGPPPRDREAVRTALSGPMPCRRASRPVPSAPPPTRRAPSAVALGTQSNGR